MAAADHHETLWLSSIVPYVCDTVLELLELLERTAIDDPRPWVQLALLALLGQVPAVGRLLASLTPPRAPTADEQGVYDDLTKQQDSEALRGVLHRIVAATEERCEYAGAARLRAAMQSIQRELR